MNPPLWSRRWFFRVLVATPEGRAHVLRLMIAAEEGDEAGVFDWLATRMADPSHRRAIAAHKADEERHASLYRACLARNGHAEQRAIPPSLQVIRVVAEEAGGVFASGDATAIGTDEDVMNTFALLLAIEERGVQQFPLIGAEFRRVGDAATADVFDEVARDERGHVKSCAMLGRRHAPDEATWLRAVERHRAVERRAFDRVGLATLDDAIRRGFVTRGIVALARRRIRRPRGETHRFGQGPTV